MNQGNASELEETVVGETGGDAPVGLHTSPTESAEPPRYVIRMPGGVGGAKP
jgi:hypothetical protein